MAAMTITALSSAFRSHLPSRVRQPPTAAGFLYLAVVLNAFSRRIVG